MSIPMAPHELPTSPHGALRRAARTQSDSPMRDLLMAIADDMASYPAVWVPNGVSIRSQPNQPSAVWTAACRFAVAVFDGQMPEGDLCNDEQESSVPGFPSSHCTRPTGHPGWHYEGETYCWGEPGEVHGDRDPWTGGAR